MVGLEHAFIRVFAFAFAVGGCVRSEVVVCGDGRICPPATLCDDMHNRCVLAEQLTTCGGNPDGTVCNIGDVPTGLCRDGVCLEPFCGDGYVDSAEDCDGATMPKSDCQEVGFYDPGSLSCTDACLYDVTACTGKCGDDTIDGVEFCDGAPPTGSSCVDLGFDFGALGCSAFCTPALDNCGSIGWSSLGSPTIGFEALWGAAADDVWAGGSAGLYHWNGEVWSLVGGVTNVSVLWGLASNDVFATTANGLWHYDGTSWSEVDTDGLTLGTVHGTASNDLFASAGNGDLAHWNGSAWTIVASTGTFFVGDVFSPAPGQAWIAGMPAQDDEPGLWFWNGTNLTVANVAARGYYYSLWGSSASDVYAVGPDGAVAHFDGNTWSTISLGTETHFLAVGGTSANDVYVSGADVIYHFDGTGWSPMISRGIARAIWGSDSANVFVAADVIRRYRGSAWIYPQAPRGSTLFAVNRSGAETIAVGKQGVALVNNGVYWRATTTGTGQTLRGVWDRVAVGDGGTILSWNGSVWIPVSSSTTNDLYDVWGTSPSDIYAVGRGGALLHYNGSAWSSDPTWSGSDDLVAIAGDATTRWAVGTHAYRWTGSSWTLTEPTPDFLANDVYVDDAGDAWLISAAEVWRYTTSNGNWTNMRDGLPSTNYRSIAGGNGFVYIVGDDGSLSWDGNAWSALELPADIPKLKAVAPAGNAFVFVGEGLVVGINIGSFRTVGFPRAMLDQAAAAGEHDVWGCASGQLVHFDGIVWSTSDLSTMTLPGSPTSCVGVATDSAGGVFLVTELNVLRYATGAWTALGGTVALNDLAAAAASDVWGGSLSGPELFHYTGASWVDARPAGLQSPRDVWAGAANDVWVTGSSTTNTSDSVAFHWNGATWESTPAISADVSVIIGVGSGHAVGAGGQGQIWHWNGATWQSEPAAVLGVSTLAGSAADDVFAGADQLIHYDGTSWTPVRSPFQIYVARMVQSGRSTFGFGHDATYNGGAIRLYRSSSW